MSQWKITIPVNGLHGIIKEDDHELTIGNVVKFYRQENKYAAIVTIDSPTEKQALMSAKDLINRSLSKICFVYNAEASLKEDVYHIVDLSNNPANRRTAQILNVRWSYIKEDPTSTLSKIESLDIKKLNVLELALAYYKLGEYRNPLRIESFFSSITVIIRNIIGKDYVTSGDLKKEIKNILRINKFTEFNEVEFDKNWQDCYADERCFIAHGKGSKLIDPKMSAEYELLVDKVHTWARDVIYHYINTCGN